MIIKYNCDTRQMKMAVIFAVCRMAGGKSEKHTADNYKPHRKGAHYGEMVKQTTDGVEQLRLL